MRLTGEERITASRSRVWQALNDPEVLRRSIPGCQSLQKEAADKLRATVEVRIGPIGARFNAAITQSDIDPERSYTLAAEGQGGTVGSAKSTIKVRLAEDGAATVLTYEVDAQVGGRLAQLGGPVIDATAKQLAAGFFKKFGEAVGGGSPAGAEREARACPADAGVAQAPLATAAPRAATGFLIAWILAVVVAALTGFLVGRGQNAAGTSDWMGLAIGLLVIVVAAAGFEYGRRIAAIQVVLDAALLERLLRGDKR